MNRSTITLPGTCCRIGETKTSIGRSLGRADTLGTSGEKLFSYSGSVNLIWEECITSSSSVVGCISHNRCHKDN